MSNQKSTKTPRGLVVDHKTSGVRYAVSPQNFDPKIHTRVRELSPHETVLGFNPRRASKKVAPSQDTTQTPSTEGSSNNTK